MAWLLPQDFSEKSSKYLRLAQLSFFVRVFQLHIGLGVVALMALVALLRSWRVMALSAATAFLLLLPYGRELLPRAAPPAGSATVRIMSANLFVNNRDADAIVRSIDEANPDVVVFAEATQDWFYHEVYLKRLRAKYPSYTKGWYVGGADVMSRLPMKVPPHDPLYGRSPIVFEVGGREVGLFPVHLVSPGGRWLVGYNREQILGLCESVRHELDDVHRPVLIAGDFNMSPLTANFYRLRAEGLRTTHEIAGQGLGNTWGPKWWPWLNRLPGVRIDHIFLSPQLTATTHRVGMYTGSDHLPIVADVAVMK